MHYKRELIKIPILGFYSMTSSSALRRCRCDTYFSTINCSVVVCLQLKRTNQREHTTVPISRMHCPALITADAQRADGLTVRGNWGRKKNKGSDREGGEGGVGRDRDREAESLKECAGQALTGWDTEREKEGACSTWEAAASLASGGESVTGSLTGTRVDKLLQRRRRTRLEPNLEWEDEKHRCHLTHTGSQPQHLQRQSEHSGYQGDWGRQGESCWDYARGRELLWIPHLWQRQEQQELWLYR